MTDILTQINKEIQDFKRKQISIVPGLTFNQYDTLQRIFFYYNSKYQTGEVDDEGDRKYFYNINKNPCKVFSKAIDFDTKNIRVLTTEGGDPLKTWFLERDLKYWMRDKQFGKVLNRIFKELPIYGSVVLKIVDGFPYFVDLRNFVVEQSAECLDYSNYIIEIHNYSVGEFRKVAEQMKWDESKTKEVIDRFYEMKNVSHIRLYERYGDVCKQSPDGKETYEYSRVFHADVGVDTFDQWGNTEVRHKGIELSSEPWDEHPYWEFHAEKMSGRWLGIGVVESLFEPQIRQNEIANLQSKSSYWAALRVFQTRDPALNRNLLADVRNGEVLNVESEVTQIDMSDRNLAFFNQETEKWLRNRDELTFSYDVVQGERLPAGTPLGSAKIATAQTLSYFEQIQEEIAMDVKEMIYRVIIPQFEKDTSTEHTIRLVGADLRAFTEMVKNTLVLQEIIRQGFVYGTVPTQENVDLITGAVDANINQDKERILTVPRGFYKGIKYGIDIDITGESVDTRVRYATRFAILQAITADPAMTTDPIKRKILFGLAEDGGINPNDLFEVEPKTLEAMAQMNVPAGRAGGGVSAPEMAQGIPGQMAQTL